MPLIKKICTDVWNSVTHGVKISSPYVCLINVARSCLTWKRAFCWSVASLALQWWAYWLWWLLRRSSPNGDWPSSKVGVGVASKLDGAWGSVLYLIVQYLAPPCKPLIIGRSRNRAYKVVIKKTGPIVLFTLAVLSRSELFLFRYTRLCDWRCNTAADAGQCRSLTNRLICMVLFDIK